MVVAVLGSVKGLSGHWAYCTACGSRSVWTGKRLTMYIAMCDSGSAWMGKGLTMMHDKHSRDIAFLNNYAQERWEVRLLLLLF